MIFLFSFLSSGVLFLKLWPLVVVPLLPRQDSTVWTSSHLTGLPPAHHHIHWRAGVSSSSAGDHPTPLEVRKLGCFPKAPGNFEKTYRSLQTRWFFLDPIYIFNVREETFFLAILLMKIRVFVFLQSTIKKKAEFASKIKKIYVLSIR